MRWRRSERGDPNSGSHRSADEGGEALDSVPNTPRALSGDHGCWRATPAEPAEGLLLSYVSSSSLS
eukprot:9470160-Pyramimonas_sp.AAC.1